MLPLNTRDADRIRRHVAAADAARFLHPVQRALLHSRGWLSMLAPRAAGGAELPLPQAVRLEEAVAAVDGSMGWVLTLCAGAGWFAGFLPPHVARDIIGTRRVCVGGSGAPTGVAEEEGDGYRITGAWDFASGAPMATHFTLNAVLQRAGQPLLDAQGAPRVRAFIVPAAQVQMLPSWQCMGMRASGTHRYRIDAQWVHADHGFTISPDAATAPGPLYRYPFYSLADVTLSASIAGMASHFLQLAREQIVRRKRHEVSLLDTHAQALADARIHFFAMLDSSWAQVESGKTLDAATIAAVRAASLGLVGAARAAVNTLYPYCGLWAAEEASPLNQVWRDFHTAAQHPLLLP
ncbi:acyl-CoA dehydrogenase [Duganella sp. FT80W]|uniref:Acyl-CoA dehydrogenase n=1 Tax=Duganella guangzhouensis TaxID=2666084 RepID=A0A6I2L5X2_9BURK|nr:acyl-CoA dehydrogenase [Duganella guangzhouensis]MRW91689.1 acyl-CoA dehydrogenase [Duganella guangzhouensis]